MTVKNLTMTFDEGRMRTCRFPRFSALMMFLSASLRTEVLTMAAIENERGKKEVLGYECRITIAIQSGADLQDG